VSRSKLGISLELTIQRITLAATRRVPHASHFTHRCSIHVDLHEPTRVPTPPSSYRPIIRPAAQPPCLYPEPPQPNPGLRPHHCPRCMGDMRGLGADFRDWPMAQIHGRYTPTHHGQIRLDCRQSRSSHVDCFQAGPPCFPQEERWYLASFR